MSQQEKSNYKRAKEELAKRLRVDVKKCFPIDIEGMIAGGWRRNVFNEDPAMPPSKMPRMG